MRRESKKRASERKTRRQIVEDAVSHSGGTCIAAPLGGCMGGLVGHEVVKRSAVKGAHLNRGLVIAVCAGHNSWVEDHPLEAQAAGLSVPGWVYRNDPARALAAASALRAQLWTRTLDVLPYWFQNDL